MFSVYANNVCQQAYSNNTVVKQTNIAGLKVGELVLLAEFSSTKKQIKILRKAIEQLIVYGFYISVDLHNKYIGKIEKQQNEMLKDALELVHEIENYIKIISMDK